jgi:hypothetical protein
MALLALLFYLPSFKMAAIACHVYSKLSIKRPVLLNDLAWIFPKSLY